MHCRFILAKHVLEERYEGPVAAQHSVDGFVAYHRCQVSSLSSVKAPRHVGTTAVLNVFACAICSSVRQAHCRGFENLREILVMIVAS